MIIHTNVKKKKGLLYMEQLLFSLNATVPIFLIMVMCCAG